MPSWEGQRDRSRREPTDRASRIVASRGPAVRACGHPGTSWHFTLDPLTLTYLTRTMTQTINLGFSRIGVRRELKRALEEFWSGKSDVAALLDTARALRQRHWQLQRDAGIDSIPSNDFSLYDQVLDMAVVVGAIPQRYDPLASDPLARYFAMARGHQAAGVDVPAMEMTKWFDTNYHYIVPEFNVDTKFALSSKKPIEEYLEAKALGIETRPVLLGPVSFLLLGKMQSAPEGTSTIGLLDDLLPVYAQLLQEIAAAGAKWVQLDEPMLATTLNDARRAYSRAYEVLRAAAPKLKLLVATYFGGLAGNLSIATSLRIDGLHVDLVRAPEQAEDIAHAIPGDWVLSAGVVDGRNIWRNDLGQTNELLRRIVDIRGSEKVWIGPSCSMLHVPVDLDEEKRLDAELKSWLAFGKQKLGEIAALRELVDAPSSATALTALNGSQKAVESRARSPRVHDAKVAERMAAITPEMRSRHSAFDGRREAQRTLNLPLLPTTTIGSFPQTKVVRTARAEFKAGHRSQASYEEFLRNETEQTIRAQEAIGLDVLVHGEFERNDMVEYFGEQLAGFAFTENGWVQSYGSRCVKPPIIYGDVSRPQPMTVGWSRFAQSLTHRHMKGMLTGPVTILQWSFVRVDQPRSVTCDQIALAIRDEVVDLEAAGIRIIQIDEPAIREGLPLRRTDWPAYLEWAVGAFRLASSGVHDETQIHTHMCYSEFNDIIENVAAMDADVVSMETSRSNMELLDAFARFKYPNEVGPGVYDIHSPRVPSDEDMIALLRRATSVLDPRQIWVNPDCGLKTRGWQEVTRSLEGMVRAAKQMRSELASV
jgi:5-methyltetrahydropteroyltriglutamate--homocysteine methyltransferase